MNLDVLGRMPNQNMEGRSTECVGETVADIVGNIKNQAMDAGFSYAAALKVMNQTPTTAGSDPYSGMLGAVVYGCLPTEKEAFDATTTGELYESNLANYQNRSLALLNAQNGVMVLRSYQEIVNYLMAYKKPVNLAVDWYSTFETPNQDKTLPAPLGTITEHDVEVCEDTLLGLRVKSWQGPEYGYVFLSETTFNLIFRGAWGFDPKASRWMSLVKILLSHWNLYADIYPQLFTTK